jgi:hypothetical protein
MFEIVLIITLSSESRNPTITYPNPPPPPLYHSMHENGILANNKIAYRPIIRILLNMQTLPDRYAHCPIRKLATAVCFLKDEDFLGTFSIVSMGFVRNFQGVGMGGLNDMKGTGIYLGGSEASSRPGLDLRVC